ncbi:MAG: hypothetical protein EXR69_13410 [Myxococcales bacterium]|nr:hypothetical protein [Myxococcales bacterium]
MMFTPRLLVSGLCTTLLAPLLACDAPTPPRAAPTPTVVPGAGPVAASGFDCVGWARTTHIGGMGADAPSMCAESPRLPGLWLVQGPSGGDLITVAILDGKPAKGGGGAVAAFFRSAEIWARPVNADDVGGVLSAVGAFPPGFTNRSPASFEAPFTYTLISPLSDWLGHGGPNAVAGALPAGPQVRATLTTGPDVPTQWVIDSGSGRDWVPAATIKWDKGPPVGPLR